MPSPENFTFAEFLFILLALIAIYVPAQVLGPSATKCAIDAVAVIMVMMILYSMAKHANFSFILSIVGPLATMGYSSALWWIGKFQRDRLRKYDVKHVYFIPALHIIGSFTFDLVVGTVIALAALG